MSSMSPGTVLYDLNGNALAVQNATSIPASTPALIFAGSDGTNSRYVSVDTSGRLVAVGAAAVGAAPSGNPFYLGAIQPNANLIGLVADAFGALGVAPMANINYVQSNTTITTTGSAIVNKNDFGNQQINLIVNITASPTGTTPSMTVTIQELDPGNGTTTFGNSASTSAITATGVYTAVLTNTHSSSVKVSWTVTGTTPSFTGVYMTVVTKVTPDTQPISGTVTATNPSVGTIGSAPPTSGTYVGALVGTSAPSWTNGNLEPFSLTTTGLLRMDGVYPTAATAGSDAMYVAGAVTTAAPAYTTGQMDPLSLTTTGQLRIDAAYPTATATGSAPDMAQVGGIVTTAAPTYTTGQVNALSLDTSGNLRVSALTNKASTSNVTSVSSATTNTVILSSNTSRVFAAIWNGATKVMYAKLGTTASTSSYSIQILPNAYWEVPNDYQGEIDAVWATGTSGSALVTELTP